MPCSHCGAPHYIRTPTCTEPRNGSSTVRIEAGVMLDYCEHELFGSVTCAGREDEISAPFRFAAVQTIRHRENPWGELCDLGS